jgi:hypothetical protein
VAFPWDTSLMTGLGRTSKDGWENSGTRRMTEDEAPWDVGAEEGGSPVLLTMAAGGPAWLCQERVSDEVITSKYSIQYSVVVCSKFDLRRGSIRVMTF